jgi:hypothetical protein
MYCTVSSEQPKFCLSSVCLLNGNGEVNVCLILNPYFFISCRHLQKFWGASGDFWQSLWDRLLDVTGEDPFTFWVYGKAFV